MDNKIKYILDKCQDGYYVEIDELDLLQIFKRDHNKQKETPSQAMRKWLERTSLLNLDWILKMDIGGNSYCFRQTPINNYTTHNRSIGGQKIVLK